MEPTIEHYDFNKQGGNVESPGKKTNQGSKSNKCKLCIYLFKQFEDKFENAQWRKAKQMQPM